MGQINVINVLICLRVSVNFGSHYIYFIVSFQPLSQSLANKNAFTVSNQRQKLDNIVQCWLVRTRLHILQFIMLLSTNYFIRLPFFPCPHRAVVEPWRFFPSNTVNSWTRIPIKNKMISIVLIQYPWIVQRWYFHSNHGMCIPCKSSKALNVSFYSHFIPHTLHSKGHTEEFSLGNFDSVTVLHVSWRWRKKNWLLKKSLNCCFFSCSIAKVIGEKLRGIISFVQFVCCEAQRNRSNYNWTSKLLCTSTSSL